MKNKIIVFILLLTFTISYSANSALALQEESIDFIGQEDSTINESSLDNMPDYIIEEEDTIQPRIVGPIVRYVVKNGMTFYKSIKYAPKFPRNFRAVSGKTKHHNVNNKTLLAKLRKVEKGPWKKVYKDGYIGKKKVSIHYFQSKSGLVYDVKTKSGWSNK
ncbi:TPA: hypothetical protein R1902_000209 [Staphylococcus delphini]|uniref:hypothetical protein n=1 Tax=Staphylococcus delphini TaxID=53344 RepID=UPI0023B2AC1A|nr:hypothetical protein [Staphylococcus delphini]EKO1106508.1 hypothetical protein [Staphylococcus pseudintermedius]MDE9806093.1 hypothetical protein [Staphylococcus delphini]HEC2144745.1 hypothetical protein [Staphylococcus delphini]HEC2147738.1 hypothetical protein [Staphylococcus delphini]HEC2150330.1 hypothetical protein [Staphylococcus delphini]